MKMKAAIPTAVLSAALACPVFAADSKAAPQATISSNGNSMVVISYPPAPQHRRGLLLGRMRARRQQQQQPVIQVVDLGQTRLQSDGSHVTEIKVVDPGNPVLK